MWWIIIIFIFSIMVIMAMTRSEPFNNNITSTTNIKNLKQLKAEKYRQDMNRDVYVLDMPFTPHTILNTYDFVDTHSVVSLDPAERDLSNVKPAGAASLKIQGADDYCSKFPHVAQCVSKQRNMYKCFGKVEFTQKECEATTDLVGNRVAPGVWDTSCFSNAQCPFYQANKNYPNDFGRCQNGFCEMPKGVERVGYRQFNPQTAPLCYNCKEGVHNIGACCAHQRHPDYVFEDDLKLRYKHQATLAQKGLATIVHDLNQAEFRALEKKLKK